MAGKQLRLRAGGSKNSSFLDFVNFLMVVYKQGSSSALILAVVAVLDQQWKKYIFLV